MPASTMTSDVNFNCFGEVWSSFSKSITQILSETQRIFSRIIRAILSGTFTILNILWRKLLLPIAISGLNILGFLIDKFLFGCPGLRQYFEHGLIKSDIHDDWRRWVSNNLGWDIYNKMSGILSNFLGILGAGIGFLTLATHLITSIYYNVRNYYHLLGRHGIMGSCIPINDKRNSVVKVIFGVLTFPIVLFVTSLTNAIDLTLTGIKEFIKHFALSCWYNFQVSANFILGKHGVYGEKIGYEDKKRNIVTKVIFGILSAPIVGMLSLFTNMLDLACITIKHFFLSCWRNLKYISNIILGEHGIYKIKPSYKDDRNIFVKIIFGILSSPLVGIVALCSNTFDLACTGIKLFIKHLSLSIFHNLKFSYNFILKRHGIYGGKADYADTQRNKAIRFIFGVISSPIVALAALVSNTIDLACTTMKHFFLSYWRNLRCIDNIVLGKHGIYKIKYPYKDDRNIFTKIIFGILSSPLVGIVALCSNTFDLACTGIKLYIKHASLSFFHNLKISYNFVLNKHGIYGRRTDYDDTRENIFIRFIFGMISLPMVALASLITNTVDLICTTIKHFGLSAWRNFRSIDNIVMGEHGIYKVKYPYSDDRNILVKLIFGALSAPMILPIALASNTFDVTCTGIKLFVKNASLSVFNNLKISYNFILGKHGIYGEKSDYTDTQRYVATRVIFGLITLPVVTVAVLLSNFIDLILTSMKHFQISLTKNFDSTYDLILGEHGLYSNIPHTHKEDNRNIILKTIFGFLTAPFVASAALLTNIIDLVCTACEHIGFSAERNLPPICNLLGERGIFGKREKYEDDRNILLRIICGTITAPIVFIAAVFTNAIDLIGTYFKNWKQTIKTPALVTTGFVAAIALAIPVFILRKTLGGFYNASFRPFVDYYVGNPFNGSRICRGILNVATLGGLSAFTKLFKTCSGYSHRFGLPGKYKNYSEGKVLQITDFRFESEITFKNAIDQAIQGRLSSMHDGFGVFRPFMRTFFGMRHKSEILLKEIHDAYHKYLTSLKKGHQPPELSDYSIFSFFKSNQFTNLEKKYKYSQNKDEKDLWDKINEKLIPNDPISYIR